MIKILFVAALSVGISSFAVAESRNPDATLNKNQQEQVAKPNSSTRESDLKSTSQQSNASEKKPDMADYCRKRTC